MAGLSSEYGNIGASALVKSAASLASQVNDYQDKLQALQWSASAQTADDWAAYQDYLDKRIGHLNGTGSLTNASKALSLTSTLQSAQRSFVSNQIQVQAINILEGNSTLQDKQASVVDFYEQAVNNGDMSLAQNLRQQYDSINQQIQYEQQQAAVASQTLQRANISAIKAGFSSAYDAIKNGLNEVTHAFKNGDTDTVNSALNSFSKQQGALFAALGVKLPKGSKLSIAGLMQAAANAEIMLNDQEATRLQPISPTDAAHYQQAASDLVNGVKSIQTPAGSMTYQQLGEWALSDSIASQDKTGKLGSLYRVSTDELGQNNLERNALIGYTYKNGQVIPLSSGQTGTAFGNIQDKSTQDQMKKQLQKLGFRVETSGGNLKVQFTKYTNKWLNGGKNSDLSEGSQVTLIPTANGTFQFEKAGKIYNLASDAKGLAAVYRTDLGGANKLVSGQYGFNQNANNLISNANTRQLQQKAIQQASAATIAQSAAAKNLGATLPQIKTTALPGSLRANQSSYIKPSSIKPGTSLNQQEINQANVAIAALLKSNNHDLIKKTYSAISKSAANGNPYDQFKQGILQQKMPTLIGPTGSLSNKVTF
jgi:hypothetical protein